MLRVTRADEQSASVKLKVEGRIASTWNGVLERECRDLLQMRKGVVMDFTDVTFIDRSGVMMLKKLSTEGVEIINCSDFFESLLMED